MWERGIKSLTLLASKLYNSLESLRLQFILINIYTILTILMIFHTLIFT